MTVRCWEARTSTAAYNSRQCETRSKSRSFRWHEPTDTARLRPEKHLRKMLKRNRNIHRSCQNGQQGNKSICQKTDCKPDQKRTAALLKVTSREHFQWLRFCKPHINETEGNWYEETCERDHCNNELTKAACSQIQCVVGCPADNSLIIQQSDFRRYPAVPC